MCGSVVFEDFASVNRSRSVFSHPGCPIIFAALGRGCAVLFFYPHCATEEYFGPGPDGVTGESSSVTKMLHEHERLIKPESDI